VRANRAAAYWSLAQVGLFSVTLVVLGRAIGWPGILRQPAAEVLPTIDAAPLATAIGYGFYLLASLALIPLSLACRELLHTLGRRGLWVDSIAAVGIASGVLKTLGIVRWLSVMPVLARLHQGGSLDAAQTGTVELMYTAFNAYAGAVGELLGVQLTQGLWVLGLGVLLLRAGWRVTGTIASLAGVCLLLVSLRVFVPQMAAINAVVMPLGLSWFVLFAVAAWRAPASVAR
jgi:hypothetical protein